MNKSRHFLTQKNHLTFASGDVEIGRCQRRPHSFKEELRNNLTEIRKLNKGKKTFLFLSGGADSETIARCMLGIQGFNFTPVIITYDSDLNREEVRWALGFCKKFHLRPLIIPVKTADVFASSMIKSARRRYQCKSISYLSLIYVLNKIYRQNCLYLLGTGDPTLEFIRGRCMVAYSIEEAAIFRFAQDRDMNIISNVFLWSPESYLSFLTSRELMYFAWQKGQIYRSSMPLKERLYFRLFKTPLREKCMKILSAKGYIHRPAKIKYYSLTRQIQFLTKNLR